MIRVIKTGSQGNAVLYDNILVDCGVSYKTLTPYLKDIKVILLTHIHIDHFNKRTIATIARNKPLIRFVCCYWLEDDLRDCGVKNIDVVELNKVYDIGIARMSPFWLYHKNNDMSECPNNGWRIFLRGNEFDVFVDNEQYRLTPNGELKIFHATDTEHLEGITALGYHIYAIEANYDEDILGEILETSTEYEHGHRSKYTHLSKQQRNEFVARNATEPHLVITLHESSKYGGFNEGNNILD